MERKDHRFTFKQFLWGLLFSFLSSCMQPPKHFDVSTEAQIWHPQNPEECQAAMVLEFNQNPEAAFFKRSKAELSELDWHRVSFLNLDSTKFQTSMLYNTCTHSDTIAVRITMVHKSGKELSSLDTTVTIPGFSEKMDRNKTLTLNIDIQDSALQEILVKGKSNHRAPVSNAPYEFAYQSARELGRMFHTAMNQNEERGDQNAELVRQDLQVMKEVFPNSSLGRVEAFPLVAYGSFYNRAGEVRVEILRFTLHPATLTLQSHD